MRHAPRSTRSTRTATLSRGFRLPLTISAVAPAESLNRLPRTLGRKDRYSDERHESICELEAEIDRLEARRHAYDPDDIARGGAFVILNHDGAVRIERGFIRPEDEKPKAQAEQAGETPAAGDTEVGECQAPQDEDGEGEEVTDEEDDDRPLPDSLVRDLTAHRSLGLRLNLIEQPEIAIVAVTHAL
jgi:ParB family chromosome partitioning protein